MAPPPKTDRPRYCPRDHTCRSPLHHDNARGYKAGCASQQALAGIAARERARAHQQRPTLVDATGTRRRLQALHAAGHDGNTVGAVIHLTSARIGNLRRGSNATVWSTVADRVAFVFLELSEADGASTRAKAEAARNGWHTPDAWDPDTIDDPAVQPYAWRDDSKVRKLRRPDGGLVEAAHALALRWDRLSEPDREELVTALHGGLTEAQIADRVHTTETTISKVWARIQNRNRRAALRARALLDAQTNSSSVSSRDDAEEAA